MSIFNTLTNFAQVNEKTNNEVPSYENIEDVVDYLDILISNYDILDSKDVINHIHYLDDLQFASRDESTFKNDNINNTRFITSYTDIDYNLANISETNTTHYNITYGQ